MKLIALSSALAATLLISYALEPSSSPVAPGAIAKDYGKIGAGEGPAWKDGSLYFTDGGHVNRLDTRTGQTTVFLSEAECGAANGLYFDHEGRLILCESAARRVTRLEKDGSKTILADRYDGGKFNAPNDVTMDSQDRIYFTDPRYGPRDTMEIRDAAGHLVEGVYRVDAPGKIVRILSQPEVDRPNGILVSPGDKYLYIADNNNNNHGGSRKLLRFDLKADGSADPRSRRVIFDWKNSRGPDGMKMDAAGRLYVAAGVNHKNEFETDEFKAGCYVLTPEGKLITFIPTGPDEATNCAFGGDDFKTLYMTSGNHLWSIPLTGPGWKM